VSHRSKHASCCPDEVVIHSAVLLLRNEVLSSQGAACSVQTLLRQPGSQGRLDPLLALENAPFGSVQRTHRAAALTCSSA